MSKQSVKTNRVSGFRIAVMIISILMLSFIMAFSMLLGISLLKNHGPITVDPDATTVRKKLPTDGSTPLTSSPIDNIGYMAYVLDNQPFYHVYANNSTKSTGYEQVTQSWKDYKNAELSGAGLGVMVCSDLSYSALVKSSSQSCFIGSNEAHIRSGNKPGKTSVPLDIQWSTEKPSIYDKKSYKYAYGEFSTEISVYVINEDTLASADEVIDNGDGTYSQTYYLNETAGCWYQYGMKTRGGLKSYPTFKRIEITFTFDSGWRVLGSYCEERTTINPVALGGMDMPSTSKTTTTYDYTESGFDNEHFAYFENFFKQYQGADPGENEIKKESAGVLDVLGGGFAKVINGGQQFDISLTLGNNRYDGKIFLSLSDLSDILNTLDVRVALGKDGKQDFYADFTGGKLNVYYSTDFAMTADINEVSKSVGAIIDWINGFNSSQPGEGEEGGGEEGGSSGFDIASLVNDLKLEITDTTAVISLQSENLLGLGLGIDVALSFDRVQADDGDVYSINGVNLNYIKYNGTAVDLAVQIVPDDGEIISRKPADNPANLADYIDSVYAILDSNAIKVEINLGDKLIEGLTLNAVSYLVIGNDIAVSADISAVYKGISLKLSVRYDYEKSSYGKVYLHVTEINGKEVDAKIYCDVGDTVKTVTDILALFNGDSTETQSVQAQSAQTELAQIINKVINLDFSRIIGKVSGNGDTISLEIDADGILSGLDVSLGLQLGTLSLTLDNTADVLSAGLPALGLDVAVSGSQENLPAVDAHNFVDVNAYLESVYALLTRPSYDIALSFAGAKISDGIDLTSLTVNAVATVALEEGAIRVKLPVSVEYGEYGVELTAYYTVNLSDGSYGKLYLNVTNVTVGKNTVALDAKVYVDVTRAVDGIKSIIAQFTPATVQADEAQTDIVAKAVETLLKLDYSEVINATNEKLNVKVNVDDILSGLGISVGAITFGELELEFTVADSTLTGKLETLGLTVSVSGNDSALAPFQTSDYVDLVAYLDGISALLSKNSYFLELSFTGNSFISDKVDLTSLSLDAVAQVAVAKDLSGVIADITALNVSYENISLELSAHYEINFDGSYGTVYLYISNVNGTPVNAKVTLDIKDAVDGIKCIIDTFKNTAVSYSDGQTADVIANVINGVLKLDFNELLAVTDEKAELKLDLDALLGEFNLGLNLGTVNLVYTPANFELSGSDALIGLNSFKLTGSDEKLSAFDGAGYIDLNEFIDGIKSLVQSAVYEIGVNFAGGKITDKIDLTGLTVNATAYATVENAFNNITVCLPMTVEYCGIAVELTAYYCADINAQDYTTVYLNITKIDSTSLDIKVYCNVTEAVSAVNDIINSFSQTTAYSASAQSDASADIISKVVGVLLNIDYAEAIRGTQEKLSLTLDVDGVLSALDLSLGGITFGELQLDLTLCESGAVLGGQLPALGINAYVKGNDGYKMPTVAKAEYLNLTAVLRLVEDMISQGRAIAEAQDVAFTVSGNVNIGGVQVGVNATGEVVYGDSVKVALSLDLTVDGEQLLVNFVYDNDGEPFVIVTINGEGVKIYRNEIDNLVNSFKGLTDAFAKGGTSGDASEISAYALQAGGYSLEEILKNDNVKTVLNAVLGFVNQFTVELSTDEQTAVSSLILTHLGGATVTLGANNCLSFEFAKATDTLYASVEAGNGATVNSVLTQLSDETYYELSEFVRMLYSAFFDRVESLSLKDVLGDNPYTVTLNLIGANSGIDALEGVTVNAELYYDEGLDGTKFTTKLMYASLDMNINGTAVTANVAYHGRTLYIGLDRIGATTLTGIKFKADVMDVFDVAEQLVRLITDTNLVETLNTLFGNGVSNSSDIENLALFAEQADENGTPASSALTELIGALLQLDLEQSFKFDKEEGTAEINVDSLSEALLGVKIGTVKAEYAQNTLYANVALANTNAWLTLDASPAAVRNSDILNPDDYMDIGFVSTLLSDLVNTVTDDNGQIYNLFTFAGSSKAIQLSVRLFSLPIVGDIELNIVFNNATITAGVVNGKFYFSFAASMEGLTAIGATVTSSWDISVTYCDGFIVLGREIHTNTEKYKVLTLEYLLDNLFDKDNSPVRWLLGTSDTIWGYIVSSLNVNIDSGLTKPKTYTLYEQLQQTVQEGKFNLSDYLSGMCVKAGDVSSVSGNGAELAENTFKLANDTNHYAFDINAEALTGGTLSSLCAVILRNDGGISGFKAYGTVGDRVSFTLDFGKYLEGVTEVYQGSSVNALGEVAVGNYLDLVTENFGFDKDYNDFVNSEPHINSIFGCYTWNYDSNGVYSGVYSSSDELETIYLDVYASVDATVPERTVEVLYKSTVHLISDFPEFADESNTLKLIYVNANGDILPATIIITDEELANEHLAIVYDAENKGRVSVYKSSETAIEVVFNFVNISGINPVSAAIAVGEELAEYPLNGYSFLGWYKEDSFDTKVTAVKAEDLVDGKITLYGKYVKTYIEAENGVNYSFDLNLEDEHGGYYVSGVNDKITQYYGNENEWLVIASYIDGYPVKYIAKEAFANVSKEASTSLVNVLVPETVVAVYDNAFLDNRSLKKVVFCADKVFFGGRADSSSSTSVFYGCYPGDAANNDNFTVYYNDTHTNNPYPDLVDDTTNDAIDNEWYRIYFYKPFIGSQKVYTMKTQSGNWTFADYVINTDNVDLSAYPYLADINLFVSGLGSVVYTAEQIETALLEEINRLTAENNSFINGFEVSVSCGTQFGKYALVNITVTQIPAPAYRVNYNIDGNAYISGLTLYNGRYYATAGADYVIMPNDGFEITAVNGVTAVMVDGSENYSFTMPCGVADIEIICTKKSFTQITLYSDVEFTVNVGGVNLSGNSVTVENKEEGTDMVGSATANSNDYTFIGWAYKASETSYVFEGDTVNYNVYYAVWAYRREEITGLSANNLTLTANVNTSMVHSVYGWYDNADFSGDPVALCTGNSATFTSVPSTILYARMQYSLVISVSGSSTNFGYSVTETGVNANVEVADSYTDLSASSGNITNSSVNTITGGEFNTFAPILEGYSVTAYRFWSDALVITVKDDSNKDNEDGEGKTVVTYLLKGRKNTSSWNSPYAWREIGKDSSHYVGFESGGWKSDSETSIDGTNRYYAYNKDEVGCNQYQFGYITNLSANIKVNVVV